MGFSWGGLIAGVVIVAIFYVGFTSESIYNAPSSMKSTPLPEPLRTVFTMLALPEDWMYTPAIFYLFLVPFIGLYAIVYGFLRELNIFTHVQNVNGILAFVISFSTLPLKVFVQVVGTTFAVMGMYSFIAFAFLFFAGIFFYSKGRFLGFKSEFSVVENRLRRQKDEVGRALDALDKKYQKGQISADEYLDQKDTLKKKYGNLGLELDLTRRRKKIEKIK